MNSLILTITWISVLAFGVEPSAKSQTVATTCDGAFPLVAIGPTPQLDTLNLHPITFDTPRLTLRTPRREDIPFLAEMFSDFLTVRYTWFLKPEGSWSFDEAREKYEGFAKAEAQHERRDLMIQLNDDSHSPIGRCAFYKREGLGEGPSSWEIGITLYRPHWKNGYGPEAVTGLLDHAFKEMGAKEIWFQTEPDNTPMLRIYDKLKIPKIRDAKEDVPKPPSWHRYHQFRITKDEWLSRTGGRP